MSTPSALRERLVFDTDRGQVLDQDRRYVLMRADVLMGLFSELPEHSRADALAALSRSVLRHGGNSVRAYALGTGGAPEALFNSVGMGAAALGWGVWTFEHGPNECVLRVRNSPFALASGPSPHPMCAPILGMFQAVCSHAWQQPVTVRETSCRACTGEHSHPAGEECIFHASPQT
ncbi:V4R domain-containing protein [Hydrogenophaga atypica]|uniref:V4R domain-containing protein n=1 Tax=Hydrogenophaga atypica TaxID=249409 RepID=A0ABW2QRT9_9BURK